MPHVDFVMVFGHAPEPGLSKAKPLLDNMKRAPKLCPDVGLGGCNQILQVSILGVG